MADGISSGSVIPAITASTDTIPSRLAATVFNKEYNMALAEISFSRFAKRIASASLLQNPAIDNCPAVVVCNKCCLPD
ncbi:MAG: hypothetical protein BWY14_01292 [Parcubacteria group bacterium ADurb.Bin192]|nr:MAG: hypothetical protein BWY14_01292 [Parcubacteria group bacterium ADurb.Bin192]